MLYPIVNRKKLQHVSRQTPLIPAIMAVLRVSSCCDNWTQEFIVELLPEGRYQFDYRQLPCGSYRFELFVDGFYLNEQQIEITA